MYTLLKVLKGLVCLHCTNFILIKFANLTIAKKYYINREEKKKQYRYLT